MPCKRLLDQRREERDVQFQRIQGFKSGVCRTARLRSGNVNPVERNKGYLIVPGILADGFPQETRIARSIKNIVCNLKQQAIVLGKFRQRLYLSRTRARSLRACKHGGKDQGAGLFFMDFEQRFRIGLAVEIHRLAGNHVERAPRHDLKYLCVARLRQQKHRK